ncbi:ABC transporter ATP-binding protein [Bacillus sp. JZ8]
MIKFENVKKEFESVEAVQGVSGTIEKGSIYGLLGSNGAGKTTLMKILAGIYKEDSGSVTVDNQPVFENVELKQKLIFIPDVLYFFPQTTIRQAANFYRDTYTAWNEERFQKLYHVFNISPKKKIQRLSKGMQRQVAFWLTFSAMPDILLMDEPLDGLDAVMRQKVKNLLIEDVAERDMTILISSHNLQEVEDLCDHIGILHKGELLFEKDLDDLKSDVHKVQLAFKGDIPQALLEKLDLLYEEKRGSVLLCIVKGKEEHISSLIKQYSPVIFDILPLTLEEIFIYEMGGVGYAAENLLV